MTTGRRISAFVATPSMKSLPLSLLARKVKRKSAAVLLIAKSEGMFLLLLLSSLGHTQPKAQPFLLARSTTLYTLVALDRTADH